MQLSLLVLRSQDGDQPQQRQPPPAQGSGLLCTAESQKVLPSRNITEEEWKERLAVKKEEVTKSNQRKLEERAEKLNLAKNKVARPTVDLQIGITSSAKKIIANSRLRSRDLIQPKSAAPAPPTAPAGLPGFYNIDRQSSAATWRAAFFVISGITTKKDSQG